MDNGLVLLPQLVPGEARQLAVELGTGDIATLRREAELRDVDAVPVMYSPTGGNRVFPGDLKDLAKKIRGLASVSGYPEPGRTERGRRDFDYAAAEVLYSDLRISVNEASKPGVWEFLTCILLPDVVRWRFRDAAGTTNAERFTGGIRNTFQRLWRRAFVLYDVDSPEPYALMRFLLEDEQVQITERPQVSSSRTLARRTAICFRNAVGKYPDLSREALMRDAWKRLFRAMPVMSFEALDQAMLDQFLESLFDQAASVLSAAGESAGAGSRASGSGKGVDEVGIRSLLRRFRGSEVGEGTQ